MNANQKRDQELIAQNNLEWMTGERNRTADELAAAQLESSELRTSQRWFQEECTRLRDDLAAAQAENERLRPAHTNRDIIRLWEGIGADEQKQKFLEMCARAEDAESALAALRADDAGRVERAKDAARCWFLVHGFIQLSANVASCAGLAHDVLAAADGEVK